LLFQFHDDTFVIFTVPFGCLERRHNKIHVGATWGIAPQLFGCGVDRPHRTHGVGAYAGHWSIHLKSIGNLTENKKAVL